MKVINVREIGNQKYELDLKPDCVERFFGSKPKTIILKRTGDFYIIGGGEIYIDEKGKRTDNGNPYALYLDKWIAKQNF